MLSQDRAEGKSGGGACGAASAAAAALAQFLLFPFTALQFKNMDTAAQEVPKKAVKALKARLDLVEKHLEPILNRPISEVYGKMSLSERAQFHVLLTFTIDSLFYGNG